LKNPALNLAHEQMANRSCSGSAGKVRVFGTRDAGTTWSSLEAGLPQEDAYLTILRQAFGAEGEGPELGLYFGATSGDVFGSGDGGASWFSVHERLAPVNSVRVA